MKARNRLTAAVLAPLLALAPSCVPSARRVRLQLEDGRGDAAIVHAPSGGGERVEIPEAELWGSFREAGRVLVPQLDPLAAAEQTFGLAEGSGTYRYDAHTGHLAPESPGNRLAGLETAAEPTTRGYLDWCAGTRMGQVLRGDCLRLLVHSNALTPHGRYVATLVMALASSFGPMLDSLGELANPAAVAATLGSAAAMYLTLWLLPEPISKVIATSLTVFLVSYLGLDLFWSLVDGWKALVAAVDGATDFGQLREAGRDFGEVLGPRMGQVLLLLVSHSLAKGLAAKGPALPRFAEASAQANKLLRVRLAAAAGVRTVTLGAGVLTVSLASSAMAVTGPSPATDRPTPAAQSGARVAGDALELARREFESVKPKFWKDQAATNPGAYSPENLARMRQGKAPIGSDGHPMELHHKTPPAEGGTNAFDNLQPLTRTEHRLGHNYKLNHPNLP